MHFVGGKHGFFKFLYCCVGAQRHWFTSVPQPYTKRRWSADSPILWNVWVGNLVATYSGSGFCPQKLPDSFYKIYNFSFPNPNIKNRATRWSAHPFSESINTKIIYSLVMLRDICVPKKLHFFSEKSQCRSGLFWLFFIKYAIYRSPIQILKIGPRDAVRIFLPNLSILKLYIIDLYWVRSMFLKDPASLKTCWLGLVSGPGRRGFVFNKTCNFSLPNTNIKNLTRADSAHFLSAFIDIKIIY